MHDGSDCVGCAFALSPREAYFRHSHPLKASDFDLLVDESSDKANQVVDLLIVMTRR